MLPYRFWKEFTFELQSVDLKLAVPLFKTEIDNLTKRETDEEFILQLSKNELLFEPGSDVMYSNTNYHLLALIIEQVTGKTYSEYISTMIFEPCEMTNSSCQTVGDVTGKSESVSTMLYFTQQNFARGCMDMHSCARDILNFEIALLNNELLSDEMTSYIFDMGIGDYKC